MADVGAAAIGAGPMPPLPVGSSRRMLVLKHIFDTEVELQRLAGPTRFEMLNSNRKSE